MKITTTGLNAQQLHDHATKLVTNLKQNAADLGIVLDSIKDGKHYKSLGYSTFDDYCQGAHGFKRRNAYQLISHAKTIQNVRHGAQNTQLPESERQTRELSKVEPELQAEVWTETIERTGKEQPTAKEIKQTVAMTIDVEYEEVDTKTTNDVKLSPNEKKVFSIISKEGGKTIEELFPYFDENMGAKRYCANLAKYGLLEITTKRNGFGIYDIPKTTIHTAPLRERFEAVKNGEVVLVKSEEKITEEFAELWREYGFSERYRLHVVTRDKSPFYNPYHEHEIDYLNFSCWRHWITNKPSIRKEIAMVKKTFVLMNTDDHRYIQYALDKSKKA